MARVSLLQGDGRGFDSLEVHAPVDGTGRHAGLRNQCGKPREGSSPSWGTEGRRKPWQATRASACRNRSRRRRSEVRPLPCHGRSRGFESRRFRVALLVQRTACLPSKQRMGVRIPRGARYCARADIDPAATRVTWVRFPPVPLRTASSMAERLALTQRVGGSNPSRSTRGTVFRKRCRVGACPD